MTKFQKYATIFIVVCLAIVAAGFACKISRSRGYKAGYADAYASIKPDTEYVDKPVYIDKPVPVEVKPAGMEMYPIGTLAQLQQMVDSMAAVKPDTSAVVIPIPMETKTYRDSTYEAQVSGYNPSLDWIKVYQRTAYINTPIPTPVWPALMISPAVNVEVLPRSVFAGAGVVADYWTGRWQFSLEVGYGVNNILGQAVPGVDTYKGEAAAGMYGRGQVKYNLIRK